MTIDSPQDRLFPDPIGQRLRLAREQAGLTCEQAARRLRLPTVIVAAMESEDWARLGAPIYVRSHVSAYLGLLNLPDSLMVQATSASPAAPRLVAMASRSRLRSLVERGTRRAVYAILTGVMVVPVVWLATHYDTRQKLVAAISLEADAITQGPVIQEPALILPEAVEHPVLQVAKPSAAPNASALEASPGEGESDVLQPVLSDAGASLVNPVIASLAPFSHEAAAADELTAPTDAVQASELTLMFRDKSWLQVSADDGTVIERDLVAKIGRAHV